MALNELQGLGATVWTNTFINKAFQKDQQIEIFI